jgi:predicted kinase
MILFIGIQASGKSSFYRERLFWTHVRVNLDMLKTRHREGLLVSACFAGRTPFVVDNTNLTRANRARYIVPARAAKFRITGYFFESRMPEAVARNAQRVGRLRVADAAVRHAGARLEMPTWEEGFDALHVVRLDGQGGFAVSEWEETREA